VSVGVLGVPLLGNTLLVALVVVLLGVVSLALGLVLAALCSTESLTVQLAMVALLAVFFGGRFVPLESVTLPVRAVSFLAPVTYAGAALRAVLLAAVLLTHRLYRLH
jgi:ABC-2 type transport system permease protein